MPGKVPFVINITGIDISTVANVLMVLIAGVSAFYAYRAYKHQRERSRKEAACKLASHYAEVILEKDAFISSVYRTMGLDEYIHKTINMNDMEEFDREELEAILKKQGIELDAFMKKLSTIDPFVILQNSMLRERSAADRCTTYSEYIVVDEETGERRIKNETYLVSDFYQEIIDLLNQLEWFGMNFQYGLADEELLYQSLHQTFLSTVWRLYPWISSNNVNNEDKTYTNVIWLFDIWRKRLANIKNTADNERKEREKTAEIARRMAEKASKDATSVKSKVFKGDALK